MESHSFSEKIMRFRGGDKPERVLYAVGPPAAGAAVWEALAKAMGAAVDLRAIRLPGRESRFLEDPLRSTDLQVRDLLPEIREEIEDDHLPYSLVGMCAGAVLAFELAVALEEVQDLRRPDSLIVINQAPPADPAQHEAEPDGPDEEVSHQDWLANVAGLPTEMITSEVLEIFGPTIEADLAALSSYEYRGQILAANIIVVGGSDIPPQRGGYRWSAFTTGRCEYVKVAGTRPSLNAELGTVMSAVLVPHEIAQRSAGNQDGDDATIAGLRSEVRQVWVSVLTTTSLDDNRGFFESGGSSVDMLRLLPLFNERFPDVFKLIDLYENPTIESQARYILAVSASASDGAQSGLSGRQRLAERRRARRAAKRESGL